MSMTSTHMRTEASLAAVKRLRVPVQDVHELRRKWEYDPVEDKLLKELPTQSIHRNIRRMPLLPLKYVALDSGTIRRTSSDPTPRSLSSKFEAGFFYDRLDNLRDPLAIYTEVVNNGNIDSLFSNKVPRQRRKSLPELPAHVQAEIQRIKNSSDYRKRVPGATAAIPTTLLVRTRRPSLPNTHTLETIIDESQPVEMSINSLNSLGSVDETSPLDNMSLLSFSRTSSDGLARDIFNRRLGRGGDLAAAATWHSTKTRANYFGTDDVIIPVMPFHAKLELNKARAEAIPHHFSTVVE